MTLLGNTQQWLLNTDKGRQLWLDEKCFFQAVCSCQIVKDRLLAVGRAACSLDLMLSETTQVCRQDVAGRIDVCALPDCTPWQSECFDLLVAAHIAEYTAFPDILFAEWLRISRPQASLLITVFNPHSCWYRLPELPPIQHDIREIIEAAESVGWQLEQCRFICHLPLLGQSKQHQYWQWAEKTVSLLLPYSALVYGLVFTKQIVHINPITKSVFQTVLPEMGQLALSCEVKPAKAGMQNILMNKP